MKKRCDSWEDFKGSGLPRYNLCYEDPPLDKELADEFADKAALLVGEYIDSVEEFRKDVYHIFPRIEDPYYLMSLIEQEIIEYDENRVLKISSILDSAGYCKIKITPEDIAAGARWEINRRSIRRKPAMYFSKRAACKGSTKGMTRLALYLMRGYGDIAINKLESQNLLLRAASKGDIEAMKYAMLSDDDLKKMVANENVMAYAMIALNCCKKKINLGSTYYFKKFRTVSNDLQRKDLIEFLQHEETCGMYIYDFSSLVMFLKFEKNRFELKRCRIGSRRYWAKYS